MEIVADRYLQVGIDRYSFPKMVQQRFEADPEYFTRRRVKLELQVTRRSQLLTNEVCGAGLFSRAGQPMRREWLGYWENGADGFSEFARTLKIGDKFEVEAVFVNGFYVPFSATKTGTVEAHTCNCNKCGEE